MLTFLSLRTGNWGKEGSIHLSPVPASPKRDLNPVHQAWSPCSAEFLAISLIEIFAHTASLLGVFSAHQTSDLPKSTLDSGGPARHLVRKGTRRLNCGSIIISSWVILCRQGVDTSHHYNAFHRRFHPEGEKKHPSDAKNIKN